MTYAALKCDSIRMALKHFLIVLFPRVSNIAKHFCSNYSDLNQ